MNRFARISILALTALLNFNLAQYPQFNALEGSLFYLLNTLLPATVALTGVRLLVLATTLYLVHLFLKLSVFLRLRRSVYLGILCLWFLEPAYREFLNLTLPLVVTLGVGAMSAYLFLDNKTIASPERSLSTRKQLSFPKLDSFGPKNIIFWVSAIAVVITTAFSWSPTLNFLGFSGVILGSSVLIQAARKQTPSWKIIGFLTLAGSFLELFSSRNLSPLLVFLVLLCAQFWVESGLERSLQKLPLDAVRLGGVLVTGILVLTNFIPLYQRWSVKVNTAYLEAQEFYTEIEEDPFPKIVTNSNLLRTPEAVAHSSLSPNDLFGENYLVMLDTSQNDAKTREFSERAQNFLPVFTSSNGQIRGYRTIRNQPRALQNSWEYYVDNFITEAGQVVDPANGGVTTSEGQAYGMWRAVMLEDKEVFDLVWEYIQANLQARRDDSLLAWRAEAEPFVITDYAVASDADVDVAYALLLAVDLWGEEYLEAAETMVEDIWNKLVYRVNGRYYLGFADDSFDENIFIFNPSYASPYAYKKFQTISTRPWSQLVVDTYQMLDELQNLPAATQPALPPNWLGLDTVTGEWVNPDFITNQNRDDYGFDAFRTFFRVGLDFEIYKDERARRHLETYRPRLEGISQSLGYLPAVMDISGVRQVEYASVSTNAALVALWQLDPANEPKQRTLILRDYQNRYWGEADNYYDQNWGWFSLALVEGLFVR